MDASLFTPPELADVVSRKSRYGRSGRRQEPFRFLLDAIGVEPPQFLAIPLPKSMATLDAVEVGILLVQTIKKGFEKTPELEPSSLRRRVDEHREATNPTAHELYDLCLTRFVSREKFEDDILSQLAFDALFRFRFPEESREKMVHLFNSILLDNEMQVSGLTKVNKDFLSWCPRGSCRSLAGSFLLAAEECVSGSYSSGLQASLDSQDVRGAAPGEPGDPAEPWRQAGPGVEPRGSRC